MFQQNSFLVVLEHLNCKLLLINCRNNILLFLQLILLLIISLGKSHDQTGCLKWSSKLLKKLDANNYWFFRVLTV